MLNCYNTNLLRGDNSACNGKLSEIYPETVFAAFVATLEAPLDSKTHFISRLYCI